MSVSSIPPANAQPAHQALQKAADGDYTAASIAANPGSAAGKVRQSDGDYRLASTAQRSTSGVQSALNILKTGG
jgi:hypothetical protein